jgi:PPIC-type PPIASE domain
MRTPYRALALTLAGGLLITACSSSTSHVGAAAVVGTERITSGQVTQYVGDLTSTTAGKSAAASDPASTSRHILSLLINEKIIGSMAKTAGVSVTPAEAAAELSTLESQNGGRASLESAAAAQGIPPSYLNAYVTDLLLAQKIGAQLTATTPVSAAALQAAYLKTYVQVHAAHILVASQALAEQILAEVKANPSSFAALALKYSTDTGSKSKGGDLGTASPTAYVAPFAHAVATAPVGSFTVVHSQFGWHVIHVISRGTTKPYASVVSSLRQQALASVEQAKLSALFTATAASLHITVSPQFGVWDAKTEQVVAGNQLSTPAASASPSA